MPLYSKHNRVAKRTSVERSEGLKGDSMGCGLAREGRLRWVLGFSTNVWAAWYPDDPKTSICMLCRGSTLELGAEDLRKHAASACTDVVIVRVGPQKHRIWLLA